MCRKPASYWGLDKPAVVAELPATSSHYSAAQMLACSKTNGFAGDLFWALNDPDFPLDAALSALAAFTSSHPELTTFESLLAWLESLPAPSAPVTTQVESAAAAAARARRDSAVHLQLLQPDRRAPVAAPRTDAVAEVGRSRKGFSRDSFLRAASAQAVVRL